MRIKSLNSIALFTILLSLATACTSSKFANVSPARPDIAEGNQLASDGNFVDAAKKYRQALRAEPDSIIAKRNLGLVLVKLGLFRDGLDLLIGVSSQYQRDAEIFYFIGEAYRGLNAYPEAVSYYQQALDISPTEQRASKSMAWVKLKQGELDTALSLILPLYREQPHDLQVLLIVSSIYLKKTQFEETVRSLRDFEEAKFNIVSGDPSQGETERVLLMGVLGDAYAGLNDCGKAQKLYSTILNERPFLASALMGSAKCDLKANKIANATQNLEKAYSAAPQTPEILYYLGKAYESSLPQRSLFYYQKFIESTRHEKGFAAEKKKAKNALRLLNRREAASAESTSRR